MLFQQFPKLGGVAVHEHTQTQSIIQHGREKVTIGNYINKIIQYQTDTDRQIKEKKLQPFAIRTALNAPWL